ncbi:MAG: alpha/beta hydrolase [Desulforhopalus sp.]
MKTDIFFLHGLESSGSGTKGRFLGQHFPHVIRPDFSGSLSNRLEQLKKLCCGSSSLILIGSSYGGLMATCFASDYPQSVVKLILLAPALNYESYHPPAEPSTIPTILIIGQHDTVTPPNPVIPLAEATFSNLDTRIMDDDHLLHKSFKSLDWQEMLAPVS